MSISYNIPTGSILLKYWKRFLLRMANFVWKLEGTCGFRFAKRSICEKWFLENACKMLLFCKGAVRFRALAILNCNLTSGVAWHAFQGEFYALCGRVSRLSRLYGCSFTNRTKRPPTEHSTKGRFGFGPGIWNNKGFNKCLIIFELRNKCLFCIVKVVKASFQFGVWQGWKQPHHVWFGTKVFMVAIGLRPPNSVKRPTSGLWFWMSKWRQQGHFDLNDLLKQVVKQNQFPQIILKELLKKCKSIFNTILQKSPKVIFQTWPCPINQPLHGGCDLGSLYMSRKCSCGCPVRFYLPIRFGLTVMPFLALAKWFMMPLWGANILWIARWTLRLKHRAAIINLISIFFRTLSKGITRMDVL